MGAVVWQRQDEIAQAYEPIPPLVARSTRDFRPPPTIESDFKRQLQHDVPHVNFTFEQIHDWFVAQAAEDYEPVYIRAQQTPIDWKSKIGNSDMSTNFKVTHEIPIYKGDMVVREDGAIYMLNWNVQNHANNQATQSIECNGQIEITRKVPDKVDELGMQIESAKRETIVPPIPCVHTEYAGRPDYSAYQGNPGINPDHLITQQMQWNDKTRNVQIDDEFELGGFTYRVINKSIAQVNIDKTHGVLDLNARRVAGGVLADGGE